MPLMIITHRVAISASMFERTRRWEKVPSYAKTFVTFQRSQRRAGVSISISSAFRLISQPRKIFLWHFVCDNVSIPFHLSQRKFSAWNPRIICFRSTLRDSFQLTYRSFHLSISLPKVKLITVDLFSCNFAVCGWKLICAFISPSDQTYYGIKFIRRWLKFNFSKLFLLKKLFI